MSAIFAKLSPSLHRNPKVRRAGRDGRDVWIFMICTNAELGATGVIPADYLDPWFLADALQCDEETAARGLGSCIRARLLALLPDGSAQMVGWDEDEWGRARTSSMTEAERKAQQRASQRAARSQAVPDSAACPDGSNLSGQASGHPDMSRDQSREEQNRPDSLPRSAREVAHAPGEIGLLVDHAVDALNAARLELDPASRPIGPMDDPPGREQLRQRLRATGADQRKADLTLALTVLTAEAKRDGDVGLLRLGMLGGAAAWSRLLAGSATTRATRGRDGPGGAPLPAKPLRGAAAAFANLDPEDP